MSTGKQFKTYTLITAVIVIGKLFECNLLVRVLSGLSNFMECNIESTYKEMLLYYDLKLIKMLVLISRDRSMCNTNNEISNCKQFMVM